MKVKCINEGYFLTLGKIYDVYIADDLDAYIINDAGDIYFIRKCCHLLEVIHHDKDVAQKTLRDEFAMAVINAMGHQHDYRKIVEYTALAEAAYEMADAILEVRNENAQTKE
ncbi:hypothetical protein QE177_04360 [Arsenophonus sp. aPb]|uniref:hypothetical protein n=1 Tax=Arsenophonus sp. aPb TaxID=3041619 RepID=UPI002469A24B|nr:hypothetical protein [Arsenophonus sp. aPb]WGL99120.1 hypothetical protein QE177_04360 [Arsenophonus sp. aPb]